MKAGVFRSGDVLIYVTSDQRVTAHTHLRQLSDVHPVDGHKVSYSKVSDTVSHTGMTFSRVEGDFGYRAEVAVFAARQQIVAPQLSMIEEVIAENTMRPGVFQNDNMLIYVASNMWMRACCRIGVGCVYSGAGQPVTYDTDHDTVSRNGLIFTRVKGNFGNYPVLAVERAAEAIMRRQVLNGKRATYVSVDDLLHNAGTKPVGKVVRINANKDGTAMSVDYRLVGTCGKQSARKHRKLGHKVTKISNNRYTWSK